MSDVTGMNQPAHVVILGCGRSGTSIFGEMFEHLEGFTYHSEPPFGSLQAFDWSRPVAIKVPRPDDGQPVSPGLPFLADELLEAVPRPRRIFWLVRHPLDAICSLRIGIGRNWGHHPRPPDWKDWLSRPLLERCAHHWAHINSCGYSKVRNLVTVIRFEDMVLEPLAFARRACRSVGLDPDTHQDALGGWAKRVQNTDNADFDEAECSKPYSRPDHSTRVGRWRENLTDREVSDVIPLVSEAAATFGYELSGGPAAPPPVGLGR